MKTEELLELYSIIKYGNWMIHLVENDLYALWFIHLTNTTYWKSINTYECDQIILHFVSFYIVLIRTVLYMYYLYFIEDELILLGAVVAVIVW